MGIIMLALNSDGSGGFGNPGFLRLFRLMRLSRMFRMVRLLRAMPELMVMIKAMTVAMRSMLFALCLLMGIVYVFAIAFTQVMENTDPGDKYFKTVGEAMQSLLLIGTMPDQHDTAMELGESNIAFRFLILLYILIASWVVMNMLVGILCEVVSVVSSVEKEELLINYVKGALKDMMKKCGVDVNGD